MYVYKRTEPNLWTVGFYGPEWEPDSDHDSPEQAAERVRWLNGDDATLRRQVAELRQENMELQRILIGLFGTVVGLKEWEKGHPDIMAQARAALARVGGPSPDRPGAFGPKTKGLGQDGGGEEEVTE